MPYSPSGNDLDLGRYPAPLTVATSTLTLCSQETSSGRISHAERESRLRKLIHRDDPDGSGPSLPQHDQDRNSSDPTTSIRLPKRLLDDLQPDRTSSIRSGERLTKRIRLEIGDIPYTFQSFNDVAETSLRPSSTTSIRPLKPPVDDLGSFEYTTAPLIHENKPKDLEVGLEISEYRLNVVGARKRNFDDDEPSIGLENEPRPAKRIRLEQTKASDALKGKPLLLPVELHHLILENLWGKEDDPCNPRTLVPTLHACALTCSRWRAAARPHIFRFIFIRHPSRLYDLAELIRGEAMIAGWIRRVRLEGTSLPMQAEYRTPLEGVEEDPDRWIYQFPSILGTSLSSIKALEIFGFAHLSPRRQDHEAFAHWISHLAKLESVEQLHLLRCEMSSNSLSALIRAFPNLDLFAAVEANFTTLNLTVLLDVSPADGLGGAAAGPVELPDNSEPTSISHRRGASRTSSTSAIDDTVYSSMSSDESNDANPPVEYPIFHSYPQLKSFRFDNSLTQYPPFDFLTVRDWLRPETLSRSLKSLDIGGNTNVASIAKFIADLGPCFSLQHLKISVAGILEAFITSGLDISKLSNLRTICFSADFDYLDVDQVEIIHLLLSQLNAPHLWKISIITGYDEEEFDELADTDNHLANKKFEDLEEFCLIIFEEPRFMKDAFQQTVKAMFPLMEKMGKLRIIQWHEPYLF